MNDNQSLDITFTVITRLVSTCQAFPASDFIKTTPSFSPLFLPHHPLSANPVYYWLSCILYFTAFWCVPSLPSTEEEARANLASQGMCTTRKFLCYPLPTSHLRTSLCRNSRESCSTPEVPLLCTSYFPLSISELRCAATRARTALHRKFLCYALPTSHCPSPNHVMPQLA